MNWEPDERMKRIDEMESRIIDSMGAADALEAITRALSYDTKEDIYTYIIRVYDLEPWQGSGPMAEREARQ